MTKYKCNLCKKKIIFKKLGVWITKHYDKYHKGQNFNLVRIDGEFKYGEN